MNKYKNFLLIFLLGIILTPLNISNAQALNPSTTTSCPIADFVCIADVETQCSTASGSITRTESGLNVILTCTPQGIGAVPSTPQTGPRGIISGDNSFVPLVGIPGVNPDADFGEYVNALYALSISLAALLAVIKIIIAGVKWMLSDMVSTISEAKSDIQGALIGLLIIISAVVLLNFINPQLTETDLFLEPVTPSSGASSANVGPGGKRPVTKNCLGVLPGSTFLCEGTFRFTCYLGGGRSTGTLIITCNYPPFPEDIQNQSSETCDTEALCEILNNRCSDVSRYTPPRIVEGQSVRGEVICNGSFSGT